MNLSVSAATGSGPVVTMEKVSKDYPTASGPVRVLTDIDFTLSKGERAAIVGPSGCGKSTLLNLMGTLDHPTSGHITIEGQDTAALRPSDLAHLRNQRIGFVFQAHHLLPQCTVLENVLVPAMVNGVDEATSVRALALLERVGLVDYRDRRPAQLSGGERQRVAVVRALINKPSLFLADEPTGSLNQQGADALADLMLELNEGEDMAMVVVTHSMAIAERIGSVLELRGGHIVRNG